MVEASDGSGWRKQDRGRREAAEGARPPSEGAVPVELARSDRSRWWRPYCSWFAWTRSILDSQIAAAAAGDDKVASAINALEELLHKGSPALAAYEHHVIFLKRAQQEEAVGAVDDRGS
ncbi:uncharacterized protein LOC127772263 [Oryza glaberrima]|uniref:uncharacterized protein LOC127772263 n=1 Tax=Oryza glaberrima TaxID=4538 RepID=UPI00224C27FC|nr:uncharacterized protein LOC127772263 [Oryza glaberrima]